ncbi:MAG: LytTR family transcriptional regulator DNA-binding domain-containing protein [Butyrivibrio sp.]|nr:LytTR family transcriptional regulator DNA-binding domain-containing protein [Butyrivibrio sp.]
MKVTIELIDKSNEEEIVLRVHELSDINAPLLEHLGNSVNEIITQKDDEIYKVKLKDIYYFEVLQRKAFVYVKSDVYETRLKLYEFEEKTRGTSFFRASKSMIVNADKIDHVKPSLSGRFEVTLLNGEKVIVSRQYASLLKKVMEI